MISMILCPNCRTIQREGDICPLCYCPVKRITVTKQPPPALEEQARRQHGFPSPYSVSHLIVSAQVR